MRSELYRSAARRLLSPTSLCLLIGIGLAIRFCERDLTAHPGGTVTLTVAGLADDSARQLSREGLEEFSQRTGIRVEFIPAWGTSSDQLSPMLQTLNSHFQTPDVFLIDMIWSETVQRYLLDLRPYLDEDAREQLPRLLRNDTVDGRVVSLPFYVNVGMLYYRTDLLKKYGYHYPPRTWDELNKMAARIQRGERAAGRPHFWGYVWQGAAYEGLTCNALEWQASFGGGNIIEPNGAVAVNNPRTIQAFRMAAGWVGTISPPSVLSYTESDSLNAFRSGNAAFLRYWSGAYRFRIANNSALQGRVGIALIPAGPHGRAQTIGGFQFAVSRYSKHPAEAAKLILYLTGSSLQKVRAVRESHLPSIPRLWDDPEVLQAIPGATLIRNAGMRSWVARPSRIAGDKYFAVSKDYYETVHRILSRQSPPEAALQSLQKHLIALKLQRDPGRR